MSGLDIAAIRAQFPAYAAHAGEDFHYLDNAATAQIVRPALDALIAYETSYRANVKRGVYKLAERATSAFDEARFRVARYLGEQDPDAVVLTSGATLALNIAALALEHRFAAGDVLVVAETEHHANMVPWRMIADRRGLELRALPIKDDATLDLDALDRVMQGPVELVAAGHVSNVTGAYAPTRALADAARAKGALFVLDGAQAAPHGPIDALALDCDLYAFSAHKCFGATGAGALWLGPSLRDDLPPALGGGEMIRSVAFERVTYAKAPHRFEAGTPPIGPAIAFGAALAWIQAQDGEALRAHERALTRRLIEGLVGLGGVRVIGPGAEAERVGTVAFTLDDVHPHDVAQILDERGVYVRAGHHCAQPLMRALDVDATTRASLAPYNDEADVDALLAALEEARDLLG